jgi:hypothetical protein
MFGLTIKSSPSNHYYPVITTNPSLLSHYQYHQAITIMTIPSSHHHQAIIIKPSPSSDHH